MVVQGVDAPGDDPYPTDHARATGSLENRFLLSAIAFQRTKQLRDGARARVLDADHKPTHLAVLEVLANTISWSRD